MESFKEKLENKRLLSQQFLSCAICIDYLDKPLRTHCLHYFCKKCLDTLFKNSSNPVPCPICKLPINRRNLLECHQLQSIVAVIQQINTKNLDDDWLTLVETTSEKSDNNLTELVVDRKLSVKSASSTAIDTKANNGVSNKTKRSKAEKENKPISTIEVNQEDKSFKKVLSIQLDPSEKDKKDDRKCVIETTQIEKIPDKKLKIPIKPPVESKNTSNKVTSWLNEYCISPSNLTSQENCETSNQTYLNIGNTSIKDGENLTIKKPNAKQTKKFFRSHNKSNESEDKSHHQHVNDIYSFDSQNSTKNTTKSKKSLKNKNITSVKSKMIESSSELSIDEDDNNILLESPVRTVKALKAKLRSERNESHNSIKSRGKDVLDSKTTRSFKRKINSKVHSFSESQLGHHTEKIENFDLINLPTAPIEFSKNDSNVRSKALVKEEQHIKTAKIKLTKIEDNSSCIETEKLSVRMESTIATPNKLQTSPILKRKVNFCKLGKIFDSELIVGTINSVACQTDEVAKIHGIDICLQVDVEPNKNFKDISCSPMQVEVGSGNSAKKNENPDLEIKNDENINLESPVSSNLLTFDQELHDEKLNLTPSKPPKKMKTMRGLARITRNNPLEEQEIFSKSNVLSSNSNPAELDCMVDIVTVSSPEIPNNLRSSRKLVLISSNESSEKRASPISFPTVGLCSSNSRNSPDVPVMAKKRSKFVSERKQSLALIDSPVKNKKIKKVDVSPIKFKGAEKAKNEVSNLKEKKSYRRIQTFDDSESDEISFSELDTKQNLQLINDNYAYKTESLSENGLAELFKDDEIFSSTPIKNLSNELNDNNKKQCYNEINILSDSENEGSDVDKTLTDEREAVEEANIPLKVFDDEDEDLLYSTTPLKKRQSKLDDSEELNLNDSKTQDFAKLSTENSPLTSILEDVTTQNYLRLKAQIKELKLKERQMEEELNVAEVAETSKLNSNLSVIGSVTDQSTSNRFDNSKVLSHHKLVNKPIETSNSESGYFGERDIVSPSPQPKPKWTPSRIAHPRIINENITAITSTVTASPKKEVLNMSRKTIINKVSPEKSRETPRSDKFLETIFTKIEKKTLPPKNYSFTASGINASQMKLVKQLAQVLNGSFKPTFVPNVTTHIIVNVGPNRLCERTLKYLSGITCGCWIVSIKWVIDSLNASCGLPEEDYEALGDNSEGAHGGPTKARLNPIPLLKGFQVLIIEPFKDLTKDQIWCLLEKCGASVVSHPTEMDVPNSLEFQQLILVDKIPQNKVVDQYNELYLTRGLITVNRDWLLDSVANYAVKPIDNYNMSPIEGPLSPRLY